MAQGRSTNIISMVTGSRTSRLSIENSFSPSAAPACTSAGSPSTPPRCFAASVLNFHSHRLSFAPELKIVISTERFASAVALRPASSAADSCITQLKAQGPSRTCTSSQNPDESKEEKKEKKKKHLCCYRVASCPAASTGLTRLEGHNILRGVV